MLYMLCDSVAVFAAKQATSPADVVGKLVELGLSSSSETRSFAEEIFAKVPHKDSGLNVGYLGFLNCLYLQLCRHFDDLFNFEYCSMGSLCCWLTYLFFYLFLC